MNKLSLKFNRGGLFGPNYNLMNNGKYTNILIYFEEHSETDFKILEDMISLFNQGQVDEGTNYDK